MFPLGRTSTTVAVMEPVRLALCPELPDPVLSLMEPSNIPGTFTKLLPADKMSTCPAQEVIRALPACAHVGTTRGLGRFLQKDGDRIPYPTGTSFSEPSGAA